MFTASSVHVKSRPGLLRDSFSFKQQQQQPGAGPCLLEQWLPRIISILRAFLHLVQCIQSQSSGINAPDDSLPSACSWDADAVAFGILRSNNGNIFKQYWDFSRIIQLGIVLFSCLWTNEP